MEFNPTARKTATVDFCIISNTSKNALVTAGACVYLQKRLAENAGFTVTSFIFELEHSFGFKPSTVQQVVSTLVSHGIITNCKDRVQNPLTNGVDGSRIKNEPNQVQSSDRHGQGVSGNQNNNLKYFLNDSSINPESPLWEIKDLIILWWNKHKGGQKTLAAWDRQRDSFKKIYNHELVKQDIEAVSMAIEAAIDAHINKGKQWEAIAYNHWLQYSKEHWAAYKEKKNKLEVAREKAGPGVMVPSSGPWLGELKLLED